MARDNYHFARGIGFALLFVIVPLVELFKIPTDITKMECYEGLCKGFHKVYVGGGKKDIYRKELTLVPLKSKDDSKCGEYAQSFCYAKQRYSETNGFDTLPYGNQIFEIWTYDHMVKEIHIDGVPVFKYSYWNELKANYSIFIGFSIGLIMIVPLLYFIIVEIKDNRAEKKMYLNCERQFYESTKKFIIAYKLSKYYLLDFDGEIVLRKRIGNPRASELSYPGYESFIYSKGEITSYNVAEVVKYIDFYLNPICKLDESFSNYLKTHYLSAVDFWDIIDKYSVVIPDDIRSKLDDIHQLNFKET